MQHKHEPDHEYHKAEEYEDITTSMHHEQMHQPNSGMHQGLRGELHKHQMEMKPRVTKAKLFWMTVLTLVILAIGIIIGMIAAKV